MTQTGAAEKEAEKRWQNDAKKKSLPHLLYHPLLKPKSRRSKAAGSAQELQKPRFESTYFWGSAFIPNNPNNFQSALLGGAHVRRFETAVFLFLIWPRNAVARCGAGVEGWKEGRGSGSSPAASLARSILAESRKCFPCETDKALLVLRDISLSPWVNIQRETSNKSTSPSLCGAR